MSEILTDDELAIMDRKTFDDLFEYSCSEPTGQTIGKRWKRNNNAYEYQYLGPDWFMGEYVESSKPGMIGIRWRKILLLDEKL